MNNIFFYVFLFFSLNSIANDWQNPEAKFDATKNFVTSSTIQWIITNDLQNVCNSESIKRGLGGFNFPVDACSFWKGPSCVIYTRPASTMHEIGHEMRHCFQGNFH